MIGRDGLVGWDTLAVAGVLLVAVAALSVALWRAWRAAAAARTAESAAIAELDQQRRELQQYLAAVTHDLKSPLAELDMMLQMLTRQPNLSSADRVAYYTDLRESAAAMCEMLDTLREHHRPASRPARCEEPTLVQSAA